MNRSLQVTLERVVALLRNVKILYLYPYGFKYMAYVEITLTLAFFNNLETQTRYNYQFFGTTSGRFPGHLIRFSDSFLFSSYIFTLSFLPH